MPALTADERDLFTAILQIQSASYHDHRMKSFVRGYAAALGADLREDRGNLYLTAGRAERYPCVAAHLDTVHKIIPDEHYGVHEQQGHWFAWNSKIRDYTGIGGDDKVGIFVALQLLCELPAVKVALFRDEEVGCRGSMEADVRFFDDVSLVLQCDRRGSADFVDAIGGLRLYGHDFAAAIAPALERHGYSETTGLMTDVESLASLGIPAPMANLSCGYYNPHLKNEYIVEDEVANALSLVRTICTEQGGADWSFARPERTATIPSGFAYGGYRGGWASDGWTGASYGVGSVSWRGTAARSAKKGKSAGKTRTAAAERQEEAEWRMIQEIDPDTLPAPRCPYCEAVTVQFDDTEGLFYCWDCAEYIDPADFLAGNPAFEEEDGMPLVPGACTAAMLASGG